LAKIHKYKNAADYFPPLSNWLLNLMGLSKSIHSLSSQRGGGSITKGKWKGHFVHNCPNLFAFVVVVRLRSFPPMKREDQLFNTGNGPSDVMGRKKRRNMMAPAED
jgi:hypothetical protein